MAAVCLKVVLFVLAVFGVRKPQFTSANSVCYSFHFEEVSDVENSLLLARFGVILTKLVWPECKQGVL